MMIVSDNGTEMTSNAILAWQQKRSVLWHYIAPGKPQQNGFVESFNGRFRSYARIWVTRSDQAALCVMASVLATPLVKTTPSMMRGNWFAP
ncbi:integrase-like protein [Acidomonas methanolica]|nr:integrase-like protein [Acidomonas methanolica]